MIRTQHTCDLKEIHDMAVWQYGSIAVWQYGSMAVWQYGADISKNVIGDAINCVCKRTQSNVEFILTYARMSLLNV